METNSQSQVNLVKLRAFLRLQKETEKLSDEEKELKGCIEIAEGRRDDLRQQLDGFRDDERKLRDFKAAENRIEDLKKMNRGQYSEIIKRIFLV